MAENAFDQARQAGTVTIVEGASDCQTLWLHSIPAIGVPGTAWQEDRYASWLDAIERIYVVIEPDAGGEAVKKWVASSRVRDRAWIVQLGDHKDPSALYLTDPERFKENWRAAIESAVKWTDEESQQNEKTRSSALAKCKELAEAPRILDRFGQAVAAAGVAGEERAAKLLYLVLCTRLLDRPVSAVIKGPSSAGKSFTVGRVLAFFPRARPTP